MIELLFILSGLLGLSSGYCVRLSTSLSSGYLVHYGDYSGTTCPWNFNDTMPNRTNLMMVFKVFEEGYTGIGSHYDYFWLPKNPDTRVSNSDYTFPWCRIYVQTGSNASNCSVGEKRPNLCDHVIEESANWPPTLETEFALFSAVMSYQFIDCEASTESQVVLNNAVVVAKVPVQNNSINTTTEAKQELINTTQASTEPGNSARETTNGKQTTTPGPTERAVAGPTYLWVAVVLACLLLISCAGLLFLLFRNRKLKNAAAPDDSPNDVYSVPVKRKTNSNQPSGMVNNELYSANPTTENETVYNDLYHAPMG